MNSKILTALALLAATPAFAAGVCIVCPPGYDCSGNKPVAHTGNAKLATIGDIPTTAAQVGAVPTTRKIAGLEMSGDITLLQLVQLRREVDDCAENEKKFNVEWGCSTSNTGTAPTGSGRYCWCRFRGTGHPCNRPEQEFSSWVYIYDYYDHVRDINYCSSNCGMDCAPGINLPTAVW